MKLEDIVKHPFLAGIDFTDDLNVLREKLNVEDMVKKSSQTGEEREKKVPELGPLDERWADKNRPLLTGFLQKANRFNIKQRRYFVIFQEGELHYFTEKNGHLIERHGVLTLMPNSRIVKHGKKSF